MSAPPPRWNHSTHYHPLILGAVPDGCLRSLDVGCGEGMLARDLRRVVPHVTAIDRDAASMRGLLAPGGTLAIVGLARNRYPADLPFALAQRVLPGVRYRRRLLFRYSLVWTKPA